MSFYRQPRRVILLGLVLSVFSFAVAMDEAKNFQRDYEQQQRAPLSIFYGALDGFNVYTLGGFILVPLMGRIKIWISG